jgi:rfaE bifunctional protein nucleotidyltransferase chain/domain
VTDPRAKLYTHDQVDDWVARERSAGRKIGFTCGAFDILHAGHIQYLAGARAHCDRLLVAVNTDDSVRRYKSPLRPVNPQAERQYVVAGLEAVDAVTTLDQDRPLALLLRWKPDLYIKGGDYSANSLRSGDAVREYGGAVEVITPQFQTSSSATIERILALAPHAAPERVARSEATGLVLVDRDGTLIRDIPFLHEPDKLELLPGVGAGLATLQAAGFQLAMVSNQQGIALGYYTVREFIAVNQALFRRLAPHGVRISRIYFCPHSAAEECCCRKPKPAMLLRAMREFDMPPERCYFVGDSQADMEAARTAGCHAVRIDAGGFSAAVEAILSQDHGRHAGR